MRDTLREKGYLCRILYKYMRPTLTLRQRQPAKANIQTRPPHFLTRKSGVRHNIHTYTYYLFISSHNILIVMACVIFRYDFESVTILRYRARPSTCLYIIQTHERNKLRATRRPIFTYIYMLPYKMLNRRRVSRVRYGWHQELIAFCPQWAPFSIGFDLKERIRQRTLVGVYLLTVTGLKLLYV